MFERSNRRTADKLALQIELYLHAAIRDTAGALALKAIGVELSTSPEDLNEGLCQALEATDCSPDEIQTAMIAHELSLAEAEVDPHWQAHLIKTPLGNLFYF